MYVLGIDVGTQGARALVVDLQGRMVAEGNSPFPAEQMMAVEPGRFEQDPRVWREALFEAIGQATSVLGAAAQDISALSVTSTSGTVCLVDATGEPQGRAIMYSDLRASSVVARVQAAGAELERRLGSAINSSYALCRLCWLQTHEPERLAAARWLLSPADLVVGWLSGEWGHSDWSNALKWGYDVVELRWPSFIGEALDLPMNKLPQVHAPGSVLGQVSPAAAQSLGLSTRTLVVAGVTDGVASQLASGAVSPGDWNSTLGTTLVLKGVVPSLLRDALGRIYSHRYPDESQPATGLWLPGGASNTGADCLAQRFATNKLGELNEQALHRSPTDLVIYPLVRRGERFPFNAPEATGFTIGDWLDEATYYAAHLEGLAFVERLCYAVLRELGATVGQTLYVAGGATGSLAGLQIRADVLGRNLLVPSVPSGAMGAAILAARGSAFESVLEATRHLVHYRQEILPREQFRQPYEERYARFVAACRDRGYLS